MLGIKERSDTMWKIPDRVYDTIKWIVVIFLPALNILIASLGDALGFDSVVVCKVITAVTVFLGALIGVSTVAYNKQKGTDDGEDAPAKPENNFEKKC